MKDIGIVINFNEKVSPVKLEKAIRKLISEYGPVCPEVIPGSFYTSASFVSFEAYEISYEFLGELYLGLCKAVIEVLPDSSFYGYSHYADADADFEGWYVYEYADGTLTGRTFTTRFGFDGSCPVCGDMLLSSEEYVEGEDFFCDTCKKNIDLKEEFNIRYQELPTLTF